ncbi:MAG: excalibur calcium-binding domain-containing protein [Synechococcaceae cyanobacterium]|jgi:hypothetical protein
MHPIPTLFIGLAILPTAVSAIPTQQHIINQIVAAQPEPCLGDPADKAATAQRLNPTENADFTTLTVTSSSARKAHPALRAAGTGFACDGRTHCSQMTSCAEAQYFLNHCPGVKMDGDRNGIPCEKQWCGR